MRSSGRTTVSRTRVRIPSVRRSRRGRCVRPVAVRAVSVGSEIVFVVIHLSVVVLDRAVLRAEAAAHGLVRAVGAEPLAADDATLQMRHFFGVGASDAAPVFEQGHGRNIIVLLAVPAAADVRTEIVLPAGAFAIIPRL